MFLFISQTDKEYFLSDTPDLISGWSQVRITENLEVSPMIIWQEDGSIDYLETDRFGSILNRIFVWYPLRFFEKPISRFIPVELDLPISRVTWTRLSRLVSENLTFTDYEPNGVSVYCDIQQQGRPFYRVKTDSEVKYVDSVSGQRVTEFSPDIEEIVYPWEYCPYPSSSKKFNLILLYRPLEKKIYLYNALSGNLLNSIRFTANGPSLNKGYSLGVFSGKSFLRPNPNMCRRFYKHLPTGSLHDIKHVSVNPWDNWNFRC